MKAFVLAVLIMFAAIVPAQADQRLSNCGYISDMARAVMMARQAGMTARELREMDTQFPDLIERLIISAWSEYDRMADPEWQEFVIGEFADEWYVVCLMASQ